MDDRIIIVPPNDPDRFTFYDLDALEKYLRVRFPEWRIDVARISQPRIPEFTITFFDAGGRMCDHEMRDELSSTIAKFLSNDG